MIAPIKRERQVVMSGSTTSTGFVPVDAVFAEDGAGYVQLTAGERLREARAKTALTLDSAAARTRIRRDYLEALETMDPRGLPARAYAIGYLRTYAAFLELDPVALVDQFKREVDTETGRAQPTAAAQTREPIKLPRGAFGAILILATVAAVAWWYSDQTTGLDGVANMPSPPDAAPAWAREDFSSEPVRGTVADIWSGLPLGEAAAVSRETVMRALSPTWLEVRDASGRILFARELAAGETYRALEAGLTVSATDGGAIQLEVDGASVGTLGVAGTSIENFPVVAEATPADPAE
jgi:cytoskeleton protein RodZ